LHISRYPYIFLRRESPARWASYSPDSEQIAKYFVAGINAYIDWLGQHPEHMPYEFRKLNYQPAKWTAEDVGRIRTHGLTGNLNSEVARSAVVCATDLKADEIRFRLQPEWQTEIP